LGRGYVISWDGRGLVISWDGRGLVISWDEDTQFLGTRIRNFLGRGSGISWDEDPVSYIFLGTRIRNFFGRGSVISWDEDPKFPTLMLLFPLQRECEHPIALSIIVVLDDISSHASTKFSAMGSTIFPATLLF
jgi:hypothetical protein